MRRIAPALVLAALASCSAGPPAAPAVVTVDTPTAAAPAAPSDPADAGATARRPTAGERDAAARIELEKAAGVDEPAKVVAALRPAIVRCFQAAFERDSGLSGRLVLRAKIDAAGKVTGVKLQDELGLDVDLASCLVNALRAAALPAPAGGSAVLTLPIRVNADAK